MHEGVKNEKKSEQPLTPSSPSEVSDRFNERNVVQLGNALPMNATPSPRNLFPDKSSSTSWCFPAPKLGNETQENSNGGVGRNS